MFLYTDKRSMLPLQLLVQFLALMTSAKQANESQHGIFYGCIDLLFHLAHLHMAHLLKFQRQTLLPMEKLIKVKLEAETFQTCTIWL